jgi:hypothetical protein
VGKILAELGDDVVHATCSWRLYIQVPLRSSFAKTEP